MPGRIILEKCCKLAKTHNVPIISSIFQTDTLSSSSEGVCRAIASTWVGALIVTDGSLRTMREKLDTSTSETIHEQYSKLQDLQLDFVDEFLEIDKTKASLGLAIETVKTLKKNAPLQLARKETTIEASDQAMAQADKKLRDLVKEANDKSAKRWALVASNQKRDDCDVYAQNVPLGNIFANPAGVFTTNGAYFINLPGHVVAMFYHRTGECLFIDANTGEWVLPSRAVVPAFLKDYFKVIYDTKYTTIETLVGFRRDDATALHRSVKPCPFATCPFGGTFTFACEHNDL